MKKAEAFLRDIDEDFYIQKDYWTTPLYSWVQEYKNKSLDEFHTQEYTVSYFSGNICEDSRKYKVYYGSSLYIDRYHPDENVFLLEQLVFRIKITPEYIKDVVLEDSEIKIVEYFLNKEGEE